MKSLESHKRSISTKYLAGLLKHAKNSTVKKFLNSWIKRGGDMVELSSREYNILNLIKRGELTPRSFSSKN